MSSRLGRGSSIRFVGRGGGERPAPEPAPDRVPEGEAAVSPAPAGPSVSGVLLDSARAALDFITSLGEGRLTEEVECRRATDDRWWIQTELAPERLEDIAVAQGGAIYLRMDEQWRRWRQSANASAPAQVAPAPWPTISPESLATSLAFREAAPTAVATLSVLVPRISAGLVARQGFRLGADVTAQPVLRRPLDQPQADAPVPMMLLRLQGRLDARMVEMLCSLPDALAGQEAAGLLVDARLAPDVGGLVHLRAGEAIWAIGPAEAGRWHLQPIGDPTHAALLFLRPEPPLPSPIGAHLALPSGAARSPHLVAAPIDALLLHERELSLLARYLRGRTVAEGLVLVPGTNRALLLAPGARVPPEAPVGVPLTRIGPGGLFVAATHRFEPTLPPSARAALFPTEGDRLHVVTTEGNWRFDLDRGVPAWTLWIAPPAVVEEIVSERFRAIAAAVARIVSKERLERERQPVSEPLRRATEREDRRELHAAAMRAEIAGDFVRAAEFWERARDYARAGDLYRRAADKAAQ